MLITLYCARCITSSNLVAICTYFTFCLSSLCSMSEDKFYRGNLLIIFVSLWSQFEGMRILIEWPKNTQHMYITIVHKLRPLTFQMSHYHLQHLIMYMYKYRSILLFVRYKRTPEPSTNFGTDIIY